MLTHPPTEAASVVSPAVTVTLAPSTGVEVEGIVKEDSKEGVSVVEAPAVMKMDPALPLGASPVPMSISPDSPSCPPFAVSIWMNPEWFFAE
eukprot:3664130-Pyramimonas_sp.AAC.1